jgi:hypothetical protein
MASPPPAAALPAALVSCAFGGPRGRAVRSLRRRFECTLRTRPPPRRSIAAVAFASAEWTRLPATKLHGLEDGRTRPRGLLLVHDHAHFRGIAVSKLLLGSRHLRERNRSRVLLRVVGLWTHDLGRAGRTNGNWLHLAGHDPPLADHLVKRYARGHGNIQGRHVAEVGQRDQMVTMLAHEAPHALAFSAQHEGQGPAVVDGVPSLPARRIEAHHPDPARLQRFECLHHVADASDLHVLKCTRRGPVHGLGKALRPCAGSRPGCGDPRLRREPRRARGRAPASAAPPGRSPAAARPRR